MKHIWKYVLPVQDVIEVSMPVGAQVLTVQEQYGHPVVWAQVHVPAETETRTFRIVGTGNPIPDNDDAYELVFVGTFQLHSGAFVGHVFERKTR